MVDVCSNLSTDGLTADGLRHLVEAGAERHEEVTGPSYRVHRLSARLGADVVGTVIHRYEAGESATALAKELSVAPSALLRLMRERNVVVRRHSVSEKLAVKLATEYEEGATVAELERRYELSHGAVLRALKSMKIVTRPKGRRPSSAANPILTR